MAKLGAHLSVTDICKVFNISRSSYYSWKKAAEGRKTMSTRAQENRAIREMILQVVNSKTYIPGARKMAAELARRFDIRVGKARVGKIMKQMNICATSSRRGDAYKGQLEEFHPCCAVQNYVNQNFYAGCRSIILTDITYIFYGLKNKCAYLCTFFDPFTHEVLGWETAGTMEAGLVVRAWNDMMEKHGKEFPKDRKIFVHSDQGSQYHACEYKELFDERFVQSMSRRGNSQDNAPQESFFGKLKERMTPHFVLAKTIDQLTEMLNTYINEYNEQTPVETLAWLTPHEFYQYKMTNIFPQNSYYGIDASKLNDIDSVIESMRVKTEVRLKSKEEANRKNKPETIDPLERVRSDRKKLENRSSYLERKINRLEEISDSISMILIPGADEAEAFFEKLQAEDPAAYEEFKIPSKWSGQPELVYVQDFHRAFD